MKKVHLICNAHIDPVWQWQWEEAAGEALSTFRIAADFCEEFDGFVFNHNEVILYKWIEEFDPALFERIQELVRQGKWHIMGGWYLQPDCNMPSGESFVRQILIGKNYFRAKFTVEPTTAINFDPFGHTRGLVQILKKSGYDSYLFCRPSQQDCPLPSDDFTWIGYDGSEITGHRSSEFYNAPRGKAAEKIEAWIDAHSDKPENLVLWGIGNHGGGPSRVDLNQIEELVDKKKGFSILHSTPEAYFQELRENESPVPRYEKDLNSWAPGCYTSQIRLKQKHRLLENELYSAEKMASHAAVLGSMKYPRREINQALEDLLTAEFHDTLGGTCVQIVEEDSLRLIDRGLELVSRVKGKAFFMLAAGQEKAKEGEVPILIYNPHPFKVTGIFEYEVQLADHNWKDEFSFPVVYKQGKPLPCQAEKELGNVNIDWRRRSVFAAELEPSQMNRFDCVFQVLPKRPTPQLKEKDGKFIFKTEELEVVINCTTGLMDVYKANGVSYLKKNAFLPIVLADNDDPWEMQSDRFADRIGHFTLMSREEGTAFSGVRKGLLHSVRVIEDGAVRTVIEAMLHYGQSFICQQYKLPKKGTEVEIQVRVYWNEKSRMLKLSIPTALKQAKYLGQVAYGVEELPEDGKEAVSQKWTAAVSREDGLTFTCINDCLYGSDFTQGEIKLSLLRSAGYAGHPISDRPVMATDRFSPRIDQGERLFHFWINAGERNDRLEKVDREALVHNEKPFILSYFPSGEGIKPKPLAYLEDEAIQITAFKQSEDSETYIIRIFEPTGQKRVTCLHLPFIGLKQTLEFGSHEVKTLKIDLMKKTLTQTDLMERGCEGHELY